MNPAAYICLAALLLAGCTRNEPLQVLDKARVADAPSTIALEIQNYLPGGNRTFHNIFVSNFSIKVNRGFLDYSTARDGLSDKDKQRLEPTYGFSVAVPDWNADGFSDLLMLLSGIPVDKQGSLYCGTNQRDSSSNDALTYADKRLNGSPQIFLGLRDCEKLYMQLRPLEFDFDQDGIPDYLEVRNGLNPKNAHDANLSISDDGVTNIEKIKQNIPIDEDARSQPNKLFAYDYSTDLSVDGSRIFRIKNIPVLNRGKDNFIAIYITETDPITKKDFMNSAYIVLDKETAGQTIRFKYWVTTPTSPQTNVEILE